jgi:hypothetical protein
MNGRQFLFRHEKVQQLQIMVFCDVSRWMVPTIKATAIAVRTSVSQALQHFRKSGWLKRHLPIPHDYFPKLAACVLQDMKFRSPKKNI